MRAWPGRGVEDRYLAAPSDQFRRHAKPGDASPENARLPHVQASWK